MDVKLMMMIDRRIHRIKDFYSISYNTQCSAPLLKYIIMRYDEF